MYVDTAYVDQILEQGRVLAARHDLEGAIAAYRRADALGHQDAAWRLGLALHELGDSAQGKRWLTIADERGHPEGSYNLGVFLAEVEGNTTEAIAAYRRADERGHPGGATNLGVLLLQAGDRPAGLDAIRRGYAGHDINAAYCLGVIHDKDGDLSRAELFYREAAERGHVNASHNLRLLLADRELIRLRWPPERASSTRHAPRSEHD
jgi:TPR repeat protein